MNPLADLSPWAITALVVAGVLIGMAKTALSGIGAISVALFAVVLPARESTGAILPLLLFGDALAVLTWRKHTDWPRLLRLFPAVVVGVLIGVAFVAVANDVAMRRTIGAVLLALVAVNVVGGALRRANEVENGPPPDRPRLAAWGYGSLAGFATMVANSAGSVMSLYLLASGMRMKEFLGTTAWFFALVNVFKLPFSIGLGLISAESLLLNVILVPTVVVGAVVGRVLIGRIDEKLFGRLVLALTVLAGANLLR